VQLDQVARVDVALQVGAVSASVKVTAKNVLGISEHIARRHYAKWPAARQKEFRRSCGWCTAAKRHRPQRHLRKPRPPFNKEELQATSRRSFVAWALYATPIPPPPSFSRTW